MAVLSRACPHILVAKCSRKGETKMDEYYQAVRALPTWLAEPLLHIPPTLAGRIHELRLRTGCGIVLTLAGRQCAAETLPDCPAALRGLRLTALQMEEIFHTLCGGSVHTHQAELAQGFLTAPGGCRVGVALHGAGRAAYSAADHLVEFPHRTRGFGRSPGETPAASAGAFCWDAGGR